MISLSHGRSIWKELNPSLEQLNQRSDGSIHQALGIRLTALREQELEAEMPVDRRTLNPLGVLHGGASAVLAESIGSLGSLLVVGDDFLAFGIELNCSHLQSIQSGSVRGVGRPLRLGKSLHVWSIAIHSTAPSAELLCSARLSVMIKPKKRL